MRMTEETPQVDVDKYEFPDKYFEKLREYEDRHAGMFAVVTGGLHRAMADPVSGDDRFTDEDADEIVRTLQHGSIKEAESMVYGRLEGYDESY